MWSPANSSRGSRAVLANALAWAAFLLYLGGSGHAPSGKLLLPIPAAHYYLWEAGFVVPVHLAMYWVLTQVCHALASRAGGNAPRETTASTAGLAMAVPSALAWLLPDVVVVATAGFEALPGAMRWYVPVSMLATFVLLARGLRSDHRLSWGQASAISAVGLLAHAAVGSPFLR